MMWYIMTQQSGIEMSTVLRATVTSSHNEYPGKNICMESSSVLKHMVLSVLNAGSSFLEICMSLDMKAVYV